MKFSEDFLAELRSRVDIEELIGHYTEIRHRGSNNPVCLCPFHNEKTPSFTIFRNTSSYYCFGCQVGGDAINFIKNIEHLDYTDAVRYLCERVGMNMPMEPVDDEANRLRRRCYEANREAAKFFHAMLKAPQGNEAREYLVKRQLKEETIVHFGLGFAPDSWDSLVKYLKNKGYTENELISFNLARRTSKGGTIDNFRNRLMFPIIDLRGNVIAFGGRVLDDSKPKYLNTSETIVFKKGQGIYALNFAKNKNDGKLILCEGYMDVIAMHQAGFTNAVAGLGTAFTPEQISLLSRYCKELTLCFDSDEAGTKATDRALKLLENSTMSIKVMQFSGGKDPDEIIKTQGRESMSGIITKALNDTEYALERSRKKYDINTDDGKLNYMNEAVQILALVKNEIERDVYISKLCSELDIDKTAVRTQLTKVLRARQKQENAFQFSKAMEVMRCDGVAKSPNPEKKQFRKAVIAEEIILASLLKHPDYLRKIGNNLTADTFVTDFNRRYFINISERIKNSRSLDLAVFNEDGDNEEMSYLSYLLAKGETLADSVKECNDCIKILLGEKTRQIPGEGKEITDEEFLELLKSRRKKKD